MQVKWIQLFVSDIVDKFVKKKAISQFIKNISQRESDSEIHDQKNDIEKNNLIMISKNDQLCDLIRATQLRLKIFPFFWSSFPFFKINLSKMFQ